MSNFDFSERLQMSHGVAVNGSISEILLGAIPGAVHAYPSKERDDRNGTDWWVKCESGHEISIDVKARSKDFRATDPKLDDLALENWSDMERQTEGWTLRTDKRTDYILWFWSDTGRWCLVPFPMLCSVFWQHRREWVSQFKTAQQDSWRNGSHWVSECVFVPRRTVWAAIYRKYAEAYLRRGATPSSLNNQDPR